ncbi:hypothetical protein DIPPA_10654 [Diplonema papillatum]|nr:hypothetical protein DIPPA_10654 [Diplonema papillatum]|eukprot:gene17656-27170_t
MTAGALQVHVQGPLGETSTVLAESWWTVRELKAALEPATGIAPRRQLLVLDGAELAGDDDLPLADTWMVAGSVVAVGLTPAALAEVQLADRGVEVGPSSMFKAALHRDEEVVRLLCAARPELLDARGFKFCTPLAWAVPAGAVGMVRLLVELGAEVDAASETGITPLMLAAQAGHADIAELLAAAGADLHARDAHGNTALLIALAGGGGGGVAECLLHRGAGVDDRRRDGTSALHVAAAADNPGMLARLMALGARETPDGFGRLLLHVAAENGLPGVARCLLDHDPRYPVDAVDGRGMTAAMKAVLSRSTAVLQLLMARSADFSVRDEGGWCVLMYAAGTGDREVLELVLSHPSCNSVNTADHHGCTPLILAAKSCPAGVVGLLLARGADPSAVSGGLTAADAAAQSGEPRVAWLLRADSIRRRGLLRQRRAAAECPV